MFQAASGGLGSSVSLYFAGESHPRLPAILIRSSGRRSGEVTSKPTSELKKPPQDRFRPTRRGTVFRSAGSPLIMDRQYGVRLRFRSPPPGVEEPTAYWPNIPIGNVDVIADGVTGVRIRFNADELISALWWQLAQTLSGNKKLVNVASAVSFSSSGQGQRGEQMPLFAATSILFGFIVPSAP
jgi:hypothetical protein